MSRKKKGRKRRAPSNRPSHSLRPGDRPAAATKAVPERRVLEVRSLLEKGRREEARELLEKLRARYPGDRLLLVTLMAVCQEMGDWSAVLETSLRIRELHPDTPEAYYYLASACLLNGWAISAAELLREFLARWPQHPQAPRAGQTLAELEAHLPQLLEEEVGPFARLPEDHKLELGRRREEVQLRLAADCFEEAKSAAACCRFGDERKARRLWKKALSLSPSFQPVRQNLEDLDQPPAERNGPCYFELNYRLQPRLFETVQSVALRAKGRPGNMLEKLGEFARHLQASFQ